MQIYLVGGAVRDQLLGLSVKERDWVVVGATESAMLAQGFIKVGKDFPVFLHPSTQEEYALARTERKTGQGYYGFACYAAPDVTLEQDLLRRDLTINAMAQDSNGHIIDPYDGQNDLQAKILRHVSPAFSEDPVRILRIARFAARFAPLGFRVATATQALMHTMVQQGEVDELVAERVWQEWQRALLTAEPAVFFEVLHQCGALARLLPEFLPNYPAIINTLRNTAKRTPDPRVRFAATGVEITVAAVTAVCTRYRIPNDYRELATLLHHYLTNITTADRCATAELLTLLVNLDAWRRPERLQQILDASVAIAPDCASAITHLKNAYTLTAAIKPTEFVAAGLQGAEIQAALQAKRLAALEQQ